MGSYILALDQGTTSSRAILFDAEQNIMGAAKLLKAHLKKFDGDYTLAAAAYNAGSGRVQKYGGVPPFKETQNYVKKVEKYRKEEDNSNVETRFVVMEDWKIDSGESGIYSSVFSSFEKALKYYNHLKENYEIDYELKDRDEDEFDVDEEINVDSKFASIEVTFDDSADYYKIWIDEKKVDEF